MSFKKLTSWGFLVLLLMTRPAAATTIFADNFNENNPGNLGLNVTPLTWTIAAGTVDTLLEFPVIGGAACSTGGGSPSGGVCIDLDGSTSAAGTLMHTLTFASSGTYDLNFWLRGNGRGAAADIVDFGISGGLLTDAVTLVSSDPWTEFVRSFVVTTPGVYTLSFHNLGGDNIGAWLDDVSVDTVGTTAVPEPTTLTLLGLGLLSASLGRRRRKDR